MKPEFWKVFFTLTTYAFSYLLKDTHFLQYIIKCILNSALLQGA